ncbi:MAG: MarR family winged helix-turn-helix transcriptional regulator [Pseudonocardiaceae bacterium]
MPPERADVREMAAVLTRISSGVERVRRRGAASTLALLQLVAAAVQVRPSDLAATLDVHHSSVTRQVQALEDTGHVQVTVDPQDRRSYLVSLTDSGAAELRRLVDVGVDRFAFLVADWSAEDVRTLGRLLLKLEDSIARTKPHHPQDDRRHQRRTRPAR